jgi:peptidoglycan/xylan/chitin deacetylase (PgdA/CDA1 family)/adenylate kinase
MIIELVGLPGAGKTTLARHLAEQGAVVVGTTSKLRLIADTLLFELAHPLAALRIATAIVRKAPTGMHHSLYINGYLLSASKLMRAQRLSRKGKIAVIDQGHAQLVVSLLGLSPSLIQALPKPDLLILVEAPRELRQKRMKDRGRTPREEGGEPETWDQAAEVALNAAIPIFETYPQFVRLSGEGSFESFSLPGVPTPLAGFGKQLMLFVSWLMGVFVPRTGAAVLMYHAVDDSGWRLSIPPQEFERQMAYLKETQSVVPLSDVVAYAKGEKQLPQRAVALTFDDGFHDLVTTVLPIIERLQIPITLFLTTDLTEKTNSLGLERVSSEDLAVLSASPLVTIESHGRTHPHLPKLSRAEVVDQLTSAAADLKAFGVTATYFAYPYGDRSVEVESAVSSAGFDAAFSITEGFVEKGDNVMRLKRIQVDASQTPAMFRARLTSALTVNRAIVNLVRRTI